MPDDKAQVILRDLVDRYGPFSSSDDDRRRCRGLLLDLAGSYMLEVNLLLRALESGAPERLSAGRTTLGLVTPRLVRELQETHGISAENATWSVDAWVFALSLRPAAAEPNRQQPEAAVPVPVPQEQQRAAAEQARQVAAEQERQRAAVEASRRQQTAPIWQQIGIGLVQIPAGEFLYGDGKQRIHLDAFAIAKTPVTNRQYNAFVDATGHRAPDYWKGGKIPTGKEDHPVVYVNWHDAVAFCQWAGVALPGEQQWEKAARGTDGRMYPWGDAAPDKSRCNFDKQMGDTAPVGKYPAGANGLFDMVGNVWEWCADWYRKDKTRMVRGGSWWSDAVVVRCASRCCYNPDLRFDDLGFRVVSPELADAVVRRVASEEECEATAEQARQAAAARAAKKKRRQEAAEQKRQRAAAEATRRQQSPLIWQQIGIEMVRIPPGVFLYGNGKRRVHLPEYWIAKTPVTNRQYKAFVDASRHRTPDHWNRGKIPAGKEDHPVVYVSWDDAVAFCQWAGVALPSEQQWEKAARGMDGRTYPWGDAAPEKRCCNFSNGVGDTTQVRTYPANANGLFDMAGNVWEWCADQHEKYYYRVIRGGSWWNDADSVRCTSRYGRSQDIRSDNNGFRVVYSDN